MMEDETRLPDDDIFAREERCRKAIKTVGKAIFMRIFVMAILAWAVLHSDREMWFLGLMAFVVVINLTGLLPLWTEFKNRRQELKAIIAEEEE